MNQQHWPQLISVPSDPQKEGGDVGEIVNWGIEREQEEEDERGEEDLIPRHEINPSHFPITLTVIHSCPNHDLNPTHTDMPTCAGVSI